VKSAFPSPEKGFKLFISLYTTNIQLSRIYSSFWNWEILTSTKPGLFNVEVEEMLFPDNLLCVITKFSNICNNVGYFPFIFNPKQPQVELNRSRNFNFLWPMNTLVSFLTSLIFGFLVYIVSLQHSDHQVSTAYWLYYIGCFVLSILRTWLGIVFVRHVQEMLFIANSAFQINALIERKPICFLIITVSMTTGHLAS